MSQQFVFWRTAKKLDASEVYARLMDGKRVRGLEPLDLDSAERALLAAFPDWRVEVRRADSNGVQTMLGGPEDRGGIDVGYTAQSVTVSCYGMDQDQWNLVIEAMIAERLPLYDPQIDARFDSIPL